MTKRPMISFERLDMAGNETLEERMRSVERNAAHAAILPESADRGFGEAHRSAEKMIEIMREKYERAGARIDALSVTVKADQTAFRSEVTLNQAAAEALFGKPCEARKRNWRAEAMWAPFRIALTRRPDTLVDQSGQQFEQFAQIRQPSLPDWMQPILKLDEAGQSDAALDDLFDRIDPMLISEQFGKIDAIIASMPVEGPSLTLMMGLLSISRPAAEHLPARARFYGRVFRLCKAMRRDAELLLAGLR